MMNSIAVNVNAEPPACYVVQVPAHHSEIFAHNESSCAWKIKVNSLEICGFALLFLVDKFL